ncbi:unnamed protein product [Rotaria sp. Silwood2]|nr:unnamed protein product [Rotaria sp. Silwood2]CAF3034502.1 unnamed protein product [Rotaria sp. Silwood2]CAF3070386.1 unnamed protein product [Rotaria sp. Silwood2]CAF3393757.1 unnamed protein product [Rotaria sp. Silwood2]CAF4262687.1 unnamed protein product [Rotaria sp. Silwood2]
MVFQDVMVGQKCKDAHDFVGLIKSKKTSIIVHEVVADDIENVRNKLSLLFMETKPIPEIQKIHSIAVIDANKVECKVFSFSSKKQIVRF